MKTLKTFLPLFFLVFSIGLTAQKPEPVHSIVRAVHDFDWYEQQAKAWKQEIDKGTKNNMAWVYWFAANRYAQYLDREKWQQPSKNYFQEQEQIIKQAERAIPNSFEQCYLKIYDNSAGSKSGTEYILKANSLRPNDPLLFPWLMNYYQFNNDKVKVEELSKNWFESKEIPYDLLATSYNELMSVEKNAILIVNGDNDTYPLWVLQQAKNIRKDVLVLNISLLYIDAYRNWVFKENDIPTINLDEKMISKFKPADYIIENVKNRPIYFSAFVDEKEYSKFSDKMYITGIALKYSEKPFNNIAILQNNVENLFLLDGLKQSLTTNSEATLIQQTNMAYLAPFLKLYEHYKLSGALEKASKLKIISKNIAESCGASEWMKYFEK